MRFHPKVAGSSPAGSGILFAFLFFALGGRSIGRIKEDRLILLLFFWFPIPKLFLLRRSTWTDRPN